MRIGTLSAIVLCGASVGFIGWRVHSMRDLEIPHDEIVEDFSASHDVGCESLQGLAEQALQSDNPASGSTITVLVLGDQSNADEPRRMATYSIPTIRKVLEGRNEIAQQRAAILADLRNKCLSLPRTMVSPIFLGVKQAIADLSAQGCSEKSHCRVFVDSDLEENVETSIKEALNRVRKTGSALPVPLDNEGIEVSFCGFAVTSGQIVDAPGRKILKTSPRDPGRDDRLQQVWRSLFTNPEAVSFEPYCSKPSDMGVVATSTLEER
jgi:hypothetical protein